ncbi:MAG: hypothetical protein IPI65_16495 [Bacteroidetes bacterium]|nr:hypothetical protein [Bacteroidota bacterium]
MNNLAIPTPTDLYTELPVDMIPDDAVVCAGNELFMSVVIGTGDLSYHWNDPLLTNNA